MTSLAQQTAFGGSDPVVTGSDGRILEGFALRAIGVGQGVGPDSRIALNLHDPLDVVRALAALDGQAEAILLLSHALAPETAQVLAQVAGCTLFVSDMMPKAEGGIAVKPLEAVLGTYRSKDPLPTEWLMTTSGTTGVPKIVPHTLRSLARSVYRFGGGDGQAAAPVWGLLYDPTRFAGLQVVLQALIGGGRLVAVDTTMLVADQVAAWLITAHPPVGDPHALAAAADGAGAWQVALAAGHAWR